MTEQEILTNSKRVWDAVHNIGTNAIGHNLAGRTKKKVSGKRCQDISISFYTKSLHKAS